MRSTAPGYNDLVEGKRTTLPDQRVHPLLTAKLRFTNAQPVDDSDEFSGTARQSGRARQ